MQRSPPRQSWILTDGHAGNVRQARALAYALRLRAHATTLEPRAPWRWAAPRCLPGSAAAFGDALEVADAQPLLAIGCGRQAALATRLLRSRGARSVQILDPRIHPRHWDLVIVPAHDPLRGANVLTLLGSLNPVDDAWLAAARAAFAELGHLPGPRTALLVGGPTAHFDVDVRRFNGWLAHVRDAAVRLRVGKTALYEALRQPTARE